MKAIKLFGAIALATAFLVGCNSNPEKISSKLILKQVNQELAANAADENYTYLQIGTFECNSPSQREIYAKLDVAGIVKYKVTRYAWWEKSIKEYRQPYKVTRNYGWWTYEDTEYRWVKGPAYDFEDHYVVKVSLTGKGKGRTDSVPAGGETSGKALGGDSGGGKTADSLRCASAGGSGRETLRPEPGGNQNPQPFSPGLLRSASFYARCGGWHGYGPAEPHPLCCPGSGTGSGGGFF